MSTYDFSTLNDKEFEQIARDLLNLGLGLKLQNFRSGKDKGIDLRLSTQANNNSIVVQAKHFIGSGYSNFKSVLKTKELPKIKLLNPDRYLVVTSLPLSGYEKDDLKTILSPFVQTSNDIYGQDDLNKLLSENPEVEKQYFKLWFSSINVFNSVINNAIEGRTRYMLTKIREKIPFYVITKKLDDANKILVKEKLLLITGQPGIGKTTLAEVLLFEKAKNGFKIYKVENISEAEDVISINPEEKQLFYFDDFLGANYNEIVNAHKTETQLTSFVDRVRTTPNKFLILTTRTVILNHAVENYEKISHSKLSSQRFEIKLSDYTKYEKALILYNHLYFNGIKDEFYESILQENYYRNIIQHKNYTPRIIAFITDKTQIDHLTIQGYHQFIINNLNNPKEIWRYSFNNQIKHLDRCLLLTLFSFESSTSEKNLLLSFEERLEYEKNEHNQIIETDQFNTSIKILLDGFVLSTIEPEKQNRKFSFINPSLIDFFIGYLNESFSERKNIVASAKFFEQLLRFNPEKSVIPLEKELQVILRDKIANDSISSLELDYWFYDNNYHHALRIEFLTRYCKDVNIDTLLLKHFSLLELDRTWGGITHRIEYALRNIGDSPEAIKFIKSNFISIIESFIHAASTTKHAYAIPTLFELYEENYETYISTENGSSNIIELIQRTMNAEEEAFKHDRKSDVTDEAQVDDIYIELQSIEDDLHKELFLYNPPEHLYYSYEDSDFWNSCIIENTKDEYQPEFDNDYWKESQIEINSEEQAIDDLFRR